MFSSHTSSIAEPVDVVTTFLFISKEVFLVNIVGEEE